VFDLVGWICSFSMLFCIESALEWWWCCRLFPPCCTALVGVGTVASFNKNRGTISSQPLLLALPLPPSSVLIVAFLVFPFPNNLFLEFSSSPPELNLTTSLLSSIFSKAAMATSHCLLVKPIRNIGSSNIVGLGGLFVNNSFSLLVKLSIDMDLVLSSPLLLEEEVEWEDCMS